MLFAEGEIPEWAKWITGAGGVAFLTWVTTYLSTRRKEKRAETIDDEKRKREADELTQKKARDIKIEDESRAIVHMQGAIDYLKVDNTDLRKQLVDLKAEMRQIQAEMMRAADEKVAEKLRAERYKLYSEHLEDLLTRNKVEFRRWSEEDSSTHPALKGE